MANAGVVADPEVMMGKPVVARTWITLQLIFFCVPPGRFFGLDAWLRPRFQAAADRGQGFARFLLWLT